MDGILAEQNAKFNEYIALKRTEFASAKSVFMALHKRKQSKLKNAMTLWVFYQDFILFPDEEIHCKMKELGFSPRIFSRILSIDDINAHFGLLEAKGIRVAKGFAIQIIDLYLQIKAQHDLVVMFAGYTKHEGRTNKNRVYKGLHSHFKRVSSNNQQYARKNTTLDLLMGFEMRRAAEVMGGIKSVRAYVLQLSQGKVEKILLPDLLNCFHVYHEGSLFPYELLSRQALFSANEFLNLLYPLFRVLLSDHKFMSEAEINGGENSYHSYTTYIAQRLKRIVGV